MGRSPRLPRAPGVRPVRRRDPARLRAPLADAEGAGGLARPPEGAGVQPVLRRRGGRCGGARGDAAQVDARGAEGGAMRAALWLAALIACAVAAAARAQEAVGSHLGRAPAPASRSAAQRDAALDELVSAYPDFLAGHQGDVLVWRDGTRMPTFDGKSAKTPLQVVE